MICKSLHKPVWLGLLVLLMAACTTTPGQIDVDSAQRDALLQLERWQAEGKLGVRAQGEAHSAYFDWQNRNDGFALRLSGPLGQGTTWLRREGPVVTLESPDQPKQQASSEEELMQYQLGWQVPVSNLRYWIKGVAAPGTRVSHLSRNPDGTLAELHQQGWQINYSRYDIENGWVLPGKLMAKRGDIALTMIIKNWQLPEPETATIVNQVP